MLTQARLKELMTYDPETGLVAQKKRQGIGDTTFKPGAADRNGYNVVVADRKRYRVSHIAFLYMTGEWPTAKVTHLNRVRDDNRWCNLREAITEEHIFVPKLPRPIKSKLTQARLKELMSYDPETGLVAREPGRYVNRSSLTPSKGSKHNSGYRQLSLPGKEYHLVHRLAFLYMTGEWPKSTVDHINGDKEDNRWCNLREATYSENISNTGLRKDNKSGHKGIRWEPEHNRWRAEIWHQDKRHYIGVGKDLDELIAKTNQRRKELHGEFARTQ